MQARDIAPLMDATWPPASTERLGPWLLRDGQCGGKRVSAASLLDDSFSTADIAAAEAAMRAAGQVPLFAIWQGQEALDVALAQNGLDLVDPVIAMAAPCAQLSAMLPAQTEAYPHWPPLAIAQDIWQAEGIGPARLAVMARAQGQKAALLLRHGDHPVGVCFAALSGENAMLHALEVVPAHRRQGHGRALVMAAATWARAQGAQDLALVVTESNTPARALYSELGMRELGRYHYRERP